MKVTVTSDTPDPDPGNNAADVDLELVGAGVDLTAYAAPVGPVVPGASEDLRFGFINWGSEAAEGWAISVELPEHASVVDRFDFCKYGNKLRSVTCAVPEDVVDPLTGWDLTGLVTIKVAKDAPAPVVLGRGAFTVMPIEGGKPSITASGVGASAAVEAGGTRVRSLGGKEMVEGDNTVTFPIKTKKAPVASPSPSDGGSGGGLPVTGASLTGLLGGGAAATLLGAAMFLLARRRRAAMAEATDESTATTTGT